MLLSKVYEERLTTEFKKQIIDKIQINIDFDNIHFSIFRYFPYCTFTLDNAKIFYSKHNRADTLLKSENLFLKINALSLFKSVYEFPEIIISNGSININGKLLDTLFSQSNSDYITSSYLVETKSIIIDKCTIKYFSNKDSILKLYTKKSTLSGSFFPHSLYFELDLNISQLDLLINKAYYRTSDFIEVYSIIKRQNDSFISEEAKIKKGGITLDFSFLYKSKDEILQIKSTTNKVSAKIFFHKFLEQSNIPVEKGHLSLESFYTINFKAPKSQKLTLSYTLNDLRIKDYKNLSIKSIKGKTTFSSSFAKNHSEIENFILRYNGFEFEGSSMLKNFPKPTILIDSKIVNHDEMHVGDNILVNGNVAGNFKVLLKINDINNLNYNSLKILNIQSDLALSNVSTNRVIPIKSFTGTLSLDNDLLKIEGKGMLLNQVFNGKVLMPNFMNVISNNTEPRPHIAIEMDRLNLDSVLTFRGDTSNLSTSYNLIAKIKKVQYKNLNIRNLDINILYRNGLYTCKDFSLNAFNGSIAGAFTYSIFEPNNISITGKNLDIFKLFNDFGNFGQTIITSKNISGLVSGKADMTYRWLNSDKIDSKSIKLISNLTITNGKLSDVRQLERLSKFLNLSEVDSFRFNTIQNQIDIEDEVISIPTMDIVSNALNFQISGKHHFDGNFTYLVKLKLKELLAKKFLLKNTHPSDYETDNKNGLNLYLKINGNNETYKIGFDKKSSSEQFKKNLNQEGLLLKSVFKQEFGLINKKGFLAKDSTEAKNLNIIDSTHNKNQKKPFKIEWDELDTTKNNNN